ncbi:MAG TPA: YfhO family protein [Methylomirabilota bacterium]|jgi:hypothetical protein|nr:YfhO family protein [Methylomirabilota bacterium]
MSALGDLARRHPDRVAVVVLVLLPLVLFAPALLPGRVLAPLDNLFTTAPWRAHAPGPVVANQALGDVTQVFHPWVLWSAAEVRAGRPPWWNPYAYTGAPFYSNPQTACLFPLTWLAWALPPALALTLPALLKVIAAGLAMYWFLRGLALVPLAAFVGATGSMLSTTLIAWLPWTFASTMPFLPLLFGLVDRLRKRGDRRLVALLALVVGLDLVAGYPQATAQALVATAAWTLARAPRRVGAVPFLLRVGAGVALGGALAAAQALPSLDYVRESNVYAFRSAWTPPLAVPPRALVTALMPYFFGTAERTWSAWQFNITSTYAGLVPIAALPLAALAWRRPPTRFFTGLAVVAGLVHYGALADVLPAPVIAFGSNLRLMPVLVFALATLGALGLDATARVPVARALAWVRGWFVLLAAAGLAAVILATGTPAALAVRPSLAVQYGLFLAGLTAAAWILARWLGDGRARWGVALAGLQVLTLAPLASYLPVRDTRWLYPTPPALAWLQTHAGAARVLIPDQVGLLYGLRQAHGYDGLSPRRVAELAGPVGTGTAAAAGYRENTVALHGSEPLSPLAVLLAPTRELLGVRFLLLPPGTPAAEPRLTQAYDGADARVFEDPAALPRAFVAARARCADDRAAVARLRGRALAPTEEVLLADCATPPAPSATPRATDARILVDDPARVVVAASTDAPAWLVLTDTWFPGWHARLDGAAVPLHRADHAFRAVALPPGRHEVEFAFTPRRLVLGVAITLGALAVVALLLLPRRAAAAAATGVVLLVAVPAAHAALPAPPFELAVAPSGVTEGDPVTLAVTPRAATGGPWDVYVLWLFSERAAFLGPDGAWAQQPVPWRARLAAGESARGVWRRAGPPAGVTLALVVVRPGADPLERLDWIFRPALARLVVAPAPGAGPPRPWGTLAVLGLAAVVAATLVCVGLSRPAPL